MLLQSKVRYSLQSNLLQILNFSPCNTPLSNIIGFVADATNVMFREHDSVASHLKGKVPQVYLMECISAHLCASHACEKLPRKLLKIRCMMCTTIFSLVQNVNLN